MLSRGNADYEARSDFLVKVKKWLEKNGNNFLWLSKELDVSRSTVSLWFAPVGTGRPLIEMANILKIVKLTKVKYKSKSEYEKEMISEIKGGLSESNA